MDGKFDIAMIAGSTAVLTKHDSLIAAAMLNEAHGKHTLKMLKSRSGSFSGEITINWQGMPE